MGSVYGKKVGTKTLHDKNDTRNPLPQHDVGADDSKDDEIYDAFVIYNPDALDQINFVKEMVDVLEGPQNRLRLFIPGRDDSSVDATAENITLKCRRYIVIISRSCYKRSSDFHLDILRALSPGPTTKRLIPVQIERCEVPNILAHLNVMSFYQLELRDWHWPCLVNAIKLNSEPFLETWTSPDMHLLTLYKTHGHLWTTNKTVDAGGSEQDEIYDALVIYNPDAEDQINFVKEMVDVLEGPQNRLRLFIPGRDGLSVDATAESIKLRCRKYIVIISPSFHTTSSDFQLNFLRALSADSMTKRMIPVIFERCEIPSILVHLNAVSFYQVQLRDWQWPRLVHSVKLNSEPFRETWVSPEVNPTDIQLLTLNKTRGHLWTTN